MLQIRSELKDHPLRISVDETTDTLGCTLGNVLLGRLDNKQYHVPFLVKCSFLEKSNTGTVACLVDNTLRWLFPDFNMSLEKLFVTDGAHYMIRALTSALSTLIWFTAHAWHMGCTGSVRKPERSSKM